ncbi:hypothetical protein SAMN05192533_107232 [Mesobacillus persicus]|uniref:Uncharacterized protein n=1 Tax=Mesobacillus persicus TaxID=930146 RepID=A0A1H8CTY2_9BACI|nr:hypothetical protein [Mesobacillus persicus]SEM98515.1 hypothetical protein SAMN05192533_107232 [Mesobacillus persicus]
MLKLKVRGLAKDKVRAEHVKGKSIIYNNKTLATFQAEDDGVVFSIHPQLEMAQYEILRNVVLEVTSDSNVEIDETECQLGYLANGETAYLIKNWEPWKEFLMGAKLKTLEGQNVILKNQEGEELGNGLLAEYTTVSDPFRITSCTIITIFGEQKFEDPNLLVEPTNQFS